MSGQAGVSCGTNRNLATTEPRVGSWTDNQAQPDVNAVEQVWPLLTRPSRSTLSPVTEPPTSAGRGWPGPLGYQPSVVGIRRFRWLGQRPAE